MALLLEHGAVRPIKPGESPGKCELCGNSQAKWIVKLLKHDEMWCAKCFLYDTEWARSNAHKREELISFVEVEMKSSLRGEDGKLTHDAADRILTSAVLASAFRVGIERAKGNRA